MITIEVIGDAKPAGSKRAVSTRAGVRVIDANPNSAGWKQQVAAAAAEAMAEHGATELLEGPLWLEADFYTPRAKSHYGTGRNAGVLKATAPKWPVKRPDLLKLTRGIEDALTGVVYRDDSQIVRESLCKRYGTPARVIIRVGPIGETAEDDSKICHGDCSGNQQLFRV